MTKASIIEKRRLSSPTVTPQALAWDGEQLWMSSRDLGTLCKIDSDNWRVVGEVDPPGVVWAGVFKNGASRGSIRGRKRPKSTISRSSRLRVDRLHSTANISGRITGLLTRPSRSLFRISSNYGLKIPAKALRYCQTKNSSSTVTTRAGGKPSGAIRMWNAHILKIMAA